MNGADETNDGNVPETNKLMKQMMETNDGNVPETSPTLVAHP